jgi:hypothetical protein
MGYLREAARQKPAGFMVWGERVDFKEKGTAWRRKSGLAGSERWLALTAGDG